jgi:hypothetical protein
MKLDPLLDKLPYWHASLSGWTVATLGYRATASFNEPNIRSLYDDQVFKLGESQGIYDEVQDHMAAKAVGC